MEQYNKELAMKLKEKGYAFYSFAGESTTHHETRQK